MVRSRLLVTVVLLAPIQLYADSGDRKDPRFDIWLGLFRADQHSQIRVDRKDGGSGTEIDLEDDLGLDDVLTRVVRGGFRWRVASRHSLSAEYYRFNRSSSSTAQTDFTWEDIDVDLGAQVDTRLTIDILETHYEYSMIRRPKHEFKVQAGLFWTKIEAELSAAGDGLVSIDDTPVSTEVSSSAATDGLAPLPVLGLIYDWQFARNWSLGTSFDWFGIAVEGISGRLINWDLGVEYQTPWALTIGLNYTSYNFDLEVDSDNWKGGLEWKFRGPQIFLGAVF